MSIYLNRLSNDLFANDLMFSHFFDNSISEGKAMKTDIIENEKEYVILMDVAGVNKEDINISLEDKRLTIQVEFKEKENVTYLRSERFIGIAKRSFYVGDVDKNDIEANQENGLLILKVSKEGFNKIQEKKKINIK